MDDNEFEELVLAHHAKLARILGRLFRRPDVVEDLLQETFVKAFTAMSTFKGDVPIERWLSRIALNVGYDELRRRKARPETAASQIGDEDSPDFFENLAAEGDAAAGYWDREDTRLTCERLLERLPPAERLVLTLTVLEDMSTADVAKATGWSQTNVKVRAFRARAKIKRLLARA